MDDAGTMSTVDDIKAKVDLADYLREQGVALKPAGTSLKACCPFHHEKSPSFMVNQQKQVYYCFGCSRGGDLFTFVQEREGLEFGEALRLLAERAGVKLEARDPRLEGKKTRALAVLDFAAKFFQHQLIKAPVGEVARAYVAKRGIAPDAAERFQIGYAPDAWDTLTTFLLQRGFTPQEVVEAGLALHGQRAGSAYDRFRHRLMFPIHDALGRVVGFTGRILDGGTTVGKGTEPPAKYVNTPETALYKKGAILYGLWFAKEGIRTAGYAVLVEGQMDVVACHEAGVTNAIAASGTALTPDQLHLLKRYTSTLHAAFDADAAGEGAAERGIDAALDAGFDVRVIRMPVGADGKLIAKDADECVRKDADAWRHAAANPIPVFDFFIERVRARFDLRNPAGQRDGGRMLVAHLAHVGDPIERAAWVHRCAESIGVPDAAVIEAVARTATRVLPRSTPQAPASAAPAADDPSSRAAERLLAILIRNPKIIVDVQADCVAGSFSRPEHADLYSTIVARYTEKQGGEHVDTHAPNIVSDSSIERLSMLADREFTDWEPEAIRREAVTCARLLRRLQIDRELQAIASRLRAVEGAGGDRAELTALEEQFHVLSHELATFR
jgi:DNA primase